MAEWFFRTMARGELNVDPIQSEFFSTEAIDGLTEALVRESIQNTLDATPSGHTARVSNAISTTAAVRHSGHTGPFAASASLRATTGSKSPEGVASMRLTCARSARLSLGIGDFASPDRAYSALSEFNCISD